MRKKSFQYRRPAVINNRHQKNENFTSSHFHRTESDQMKVMKQNNAQRPPFVFSYPRIVKKNKRDSISQDMTDDNPCIIITTPIDTNQVTPSTDILKSIETVWRKTFETLLPPFLGFILFCFFICLLFCCCFLVFGFLFFLGFFFGFFCCFFGGVFCKKTEKKRKGFKRNHDNRIEYQLK